MAVISMKQLLEAGVHFGHKHKMLLKKKLKEVVNTTLITVG